MTWIWKEPLPGTSLYPHHRRWDCRRAIVEALRNLDLPMIATRCIARGRAFNAIMYDCHDPLASAYARRLDKADRLLAERVSAELVAERERPRGRVGYVLRETGIDESRRSCRVCGGDGWTDGSAELRRDGRVGDTTCIACGGTGREDT